MSNITVENDNIAKEYALEGGVLRPVAYLNKITGERTELIDASEFVISYVEKKSMLSTKYGALRAEDMECEYIDGELRFKGKDSLGRVWNVIETLDTDGGTLHKSLSLTCSEDAFIDYIDMETFRLPDGIYSWSAPDVTVKVHIPPYITTLGQPLYVGSVFLGTEFPTADNKIEQGRTKARYYVGRPLSQVCDKDGYYRTVPYVAGSGIGARTDKMKDSFFAYIHATSRNPRFRMQYNSWYDHMLDISSSNIEKEFRAVSEGFRSHGLRDLDCYVVDDGWVDYDKKEFWAFREDRFPNKFEKESKLTKELGSTFGVWFGPRGGYTQANGYGSVMKKLGYSKCRQSHDICTADPRYVDALIDKMISFVKEYNVTYFKIDGFACAACKSKDHGHPVGGYKDLYFYTFLWERWLKGFERIHAVNDEVFLNVTSYSHCSPWFMRHADAVWINNAADMYFEGEGSTLDKCLNYRDGRYQDFSEVRQLQFPVAYIYNHEPCYGKMNYYPPLPHPSHNTVTYTDEEFEKYMYGCMMRGSGFIELYFSPDMLSDAKWSSAVKVLKWAEENFDILKNSAYFGGVPKKGETYGYYARNGKRAIASLRNPSDKTVAYDFDNAERSFCDAPYSMREFYPEQGNTVSYAAGERAKIELKPYEMKLFYIDIE